MPIYISLLRGINVSGQHLIKMEALRKSYEKRGFSAVKTYIQSGNVLFASDETDPRLLEQQIAEQIERDFGFRVPVLVLIAEELKQIIENNPFGDKDIEHLHISFLATPPDTSDWQQVLDKKQAEEAIHVSEKAVYLYCPNGYGKTKLENAFLEKKLKTKATTRNGKTSWALLKLV